jgi:uncharacterized protein
MELEIRRETVNLFEGKENFNILHLSDIHVWFSKSILYIIEAKIDELKPDIVVMTGDYYDLPIGARLFRQFMISVAKKYQIIFIKGNHDDIYGTKISNLLLEIPNTVHLENMKYAFKSSKGFQFNFSDWSQVSDLKITQNQKNIVLIHNPEKIIDSELDNIDLILAGHLHGGQFIFFKDRNLNLYPASFIYKNCCDRKQIFNTTLIVSKGIGDTFPFRYNCPKEIILITIN